MIRKPRFKDWQPGEYRIKVEIVTPDGRQLKTYMPHLTANEGQAMIALMLDIACAERSIEGEMLKAVLAARKRKKATDG